MLHLLPLLLACDPSPTDDTATCDDVQQSFEDAAAEIRSCTEDAECGQVLTGTSCGCTRDWVARLDADPTEFYALLDDAASCDLGLDGVCDCPEAYGFECADSTCAWDYDMGAYLPDCQADHGDPYDVGGVTLEGDTLTVTLSAGGGCEDHDWALCWPDGSFAESDPVQAFLEVWHDDHDDACDAIISEDVAFDLVPLKTAWQDAYGGGSGTILISVGGESVEYSF